MKPKALILAGFGLNCDTETKYAFDRVGANVQIVHINDVINKKKNFNNYQILVFQGGFSYGDDTGAGNAFAAQVRNHLWEDILSFIKKDNLVIGICNGFQILVNLGLLPALHNIYGNRTVALVHNSNARYTVRFVDLQVESKSPWLTDIDRISLPIAHGEGKFFAEKEILQQLIMKKMIALRYTDGDMCKWLGYSPNPNGSLRDIAGITDTTGRILGLMPHPERAQFMCQMPNFTYLKEKYEREGKKLPAEGPGLAIFRNAVKYFKNSY